MFHVEHIHIYKSFYLKIMNTNKAFLITGFNWDLLERIFLPNQKNEKAIFCCELSKALQKSFEPTKISFPFLVETRTYLCANLNRTEKIFLQSNDESMDIDFFSYIQIDIKETSKTVSSEVIYNFNEMKEDDKKTTSKLFTFIGVEKNIELGF